MNDGSGEQMREAKRKRFAKTADKAAVNKANKSKVSRMSKDVTDVVFNAAADDRLMGDDGMANSRWAGSKGEGTRATGVVFGCACEKSRDRHG